MKWFQLPPEPGKTDITSILDLPPLPEISYNDNDADDGSDNLSDFGGTNGQPPIILKNTEFSLKQFAKSIGQANYSAFNKCKIV